MRFPPLFTFALVCLQLSSIAAPIDLRQRTVSNSRQFYVYAGVPALRSQVASFADEVKGDVLALLGEQDRWKHPIVITLEKRASSDANLESVKTTLVQTEDGFRVELNVWIGDNPAEINLQKQIVRAVMLEIAYRDHPSAIHPGEKIAEPPWWLLDGAIEIFKRGDGFLDPALFKRLIETNKIPSLEQFVSARPMDYGGQTAESIDKACAMCLVELLLQQPMGRENLSRLVQHLTETSDDPMAMLLREFPSLGGNQNVAKWWTLSIAKLSAGDRYAGLSPEATDAQLALLLQFALPADKAGHKKSFGIADWDSYIKLPAAKPAMVQLQGDLVALSTRANALYRGVIAEYEQIASALARGKTHGLKEKLVKVDQNREIILRRTREVSDYLNWFEATQFGSPSNAFDGYMKAANEISAPVQRNDAITKYLDGLEQEF